MRIQKKLNFCCATNIYSDIYSSQWHIETVSTTLNSIDISIGVCARLRLHDSKAHVETIESSTKWENRSDADHECTILLCFVFFRNVQIRRIIFFVYFLVRKVLRKLNAEMLVRSRYGRQKIHIFEIKNGFVLSLFKAGSHKIQVYLRSRNWINAQLNRVVQTSVRLNCLRFTDLILSSSAAYNINRILLVNECG